MNTIDHTSDELPFFQDPDIVRKMSDTLMRSLIIDPSPRSFFDDRDEFEYTRGACDALAWVIMRHEGKALIRWVEALADRIAEYDPKRIAVDPVFQLRRRQVLILDRQAIERIRRKETTFDKELSDAKDDAEGKYLRSVCDLKTAVCKKCGRNHPAGTPHDPTTPLFRLYVIGRDAAVPTWDDAIADCEELIQSRVITVLRRHRSWPDVTPLTPELLQDIRRATGAES